MNCKIKLDKNVINVLLIICVIVIIILLILVSMKKNENFQSNTCSLSEKIIDTWESQEDESQNNEPDSAKTTEEMMESLLKQEELCQQLETQQEQKNNERLLSLQKQKLQEIENQDKKIQMLSQVLQNLKNKQAQKNLMINKCQNSYQTDLNEQYSEIQTLVDNGLENTDLNVNIVASQELQNLINSVKEAKVKAKLNPLPNNDPKTINEHLNTCINRIDNDPHLPNISKSNLVKEMKLFVKNPYNNSKALKSIITDLNNIKDEDLRSDIIVILISLLPKPRYQTYK